MTSVVYPDLPENGLIVLIGASGAGKSTLTRTWPASQVLSLDGLRGTVSDDFSVKFSMLSETARPSAQPMTGLPRSTELGCSLHRRPGAAPAGDGAVPLLGDTV